LVKGLATGWTVIRSNCSGSEIFHTHPDWPWGPASLLLNGYWVSFPRIKWLGRVVYRPPPTSAEVKERVEPYFYSPSEPSMVCSRMNFTFYLLLSYTPGLSNRLFPSGFPAETVYAFLFFPICVRCPIPFILLCLITQIIFCEEERS